MFNDLALQTNNVKSGPRRRRHQRQRRAVQLRQVQPGHRGRRPSSTPASSTASRAKKDDPSATKLLTKFNELLAKAKSDGKYNQIYKKWFGVEPKK